MKMEDIEFVRGHLVKNPQHESLAVEIARNIQMQAANAVARFVFDTHPWRIGLVDRCEARQSLHPVKSAGAVFADDGDPFTVDLQSISSGSSWQSCVDADVQRCAARLLL